MSANTGSGGVRNLRAMFENKGADQSTSPPSRGRSPSGSVNSGNSRPVSKVRASFVAVERPGEFTSGQQRGLRKASDVSSMAEAKENEAVTRTSTVGQEQTKSPTSPHTSKQSIDGGLGSILKGSAFEGTPHKQTQHEQPAAPNASTPNGKAKASTTSSGVGSRAAEMIKKMQSPEKHGPPPSTTVVTKSDAKPIKNPHPKPMVKPSPTSPRSPRLERSSPKTPTSPATAKSMVRGGPAKIKGVMESAKRASEGREAVRKEQPKPTAKKEPEPKPAPKQKPEVKKEPEAKPIPEKKTEPKPAVKETEPRPKPRINGVKKESTSASTAKPTSPRSPTKPAKLPLAATRTTAAAAAKHDPQQPAQQPVKNSAPRASLPATQSRATASTTSSSLHKRPSRASLAPNGNERPKSRVSLSKPDEGFLARMMRPTQSSSQKTHEKAEPSSPPRTSKSKPAPRTSIKGSRKSDQSESQGSKLDDVDEGPADAQPGLSKKATVTEDKSSVPPQQSNILSSGPNTSTTVNGASS